MENAAFVFTALGFDPTVGTGVDSDVLTPAQREVLATLACGLDRSQLASELRVGIDTVGYHLKNLRKKLGGASLQELTLFAVFQGLVSAERLDQALPSRRFCANSDSGKNYRIR